MAFCVNWEEDLNEDDKVCLTEVDVAIPGFVGENISWWIVEDPSKEVVFDDSKNSENGFLMEGEFEGDSVEIDSRIPPPG